MAWGVCVCCCTWNHGFFFRCQSPLLFAFSCAFILQCKRKHNLSLLKLTYRNAGERDIWKVCDDSDDNRVTASPAAAAYWFGWMGKWCEHFRRHTACSEEQWYLFFCRYFFRCLLLLRNLLFYRFYGRQQLFALSLLWNIMKTLSVLCIYIPLPVCPPSPHWTRRIHIVFANIHNGAFGLGERERNAPRASDLPIFIISFPLVVRCKLDVLQRVLAYLRYLPTNL